jgi:hypothetical protein
MLTFWAKQIVSFLITLFFNKLMIFQMFKEATYAHLPSFKPYDHVSKHCHQPTSTTTTPPIHVHLPDLSFTNAPLSDQQGQRHTNAKWPSPALSPINISSDDDTPLICFSPISDVLHDLDCTMLLLNYPQYESALVTNGVAYVNSVANVASNLFTDIIHMPQEAVGEFLKHVQALTRRAQKGKGKANAIDIKEEKEN